MESSNTHTSNVRCVTKIHQWIKPKTNTKLIIKKNPVKSNFFSIVIQTSLKNSPIKRGAIEKV